MKKKLMNIVLALTVVVAGFTGFTGTANAETVGVSWDVEYTGANFTSNFEEKVGSAKAEITSAMPGDTITYAVTYKNSTDKDATFYLNTGVLQTLEETNNTSAAGGAYSYVITNNGSELYNSNTIGGDNETVLGLNQVNRGENAYFSLGSIAAGATGTIQVSIVLDGNTQNNSYMETLARLNIQFGAEETQTPASTEDRNNKIIEYVQLDNGTEVVILDDDIPLAGGGNPRTGDSILPLLFCGVALIIGIFLIAMYFKMVSEQRRGEA